MGDEVPLGHIRLFRKELLESDLLNLDFVDRECGFLDEKFVEKFKMLYEQDQNLALKRLLRQIFTKHPERTHIFFPLIRDSCRDETEILNELCLTHMKEASKEKYLELCSPHDCKIDKMGTCLRPELFLENLKKKYANRYADMIRKVEPLLKNQYFDAASCQILRSMPLTATDDNDDQWWYHILDVCDCDTRNRALLRCIEKDYRRIIDELRSEQRAKTFIAPKTFDDTFDDTIKDEDREFRSQSSYLDHRIELKESYLLPDPEELILRPYQEELLEGALKENTIICAPTGSGKTIVAAKIIIEHLLEKRETGNGEARVVMFVPTIPLVDQQCVYLNKFMRKKYNILGASGAEGVDELGKKILATDVVVITPQLFYNLLTDPRKDERLFIADFTLFVFDECHHCRLGHPYKKIMEVVLMFGGQRPHIVGLTASVGVGTGKDRDMDDCIDHIITVCANMSANSITTVRNRQTSLNEVVVRPDDRIEKVSRDQDSAVRQKFEEACRKFVEHGRKKLERVELFGRREKLNTFPEMSKISAFFGFINQLRQRVTIDNSQKIPEKNAFLQIIQRIHMFYTMLNLVDLVPAKDTFMICDSYDCESNEDHLLEEQKKTLDDIWKLISDAKVEEDDLQKEILNKLKHILVEQYDELPESRTLIFVSTRRLAQLVCKHLNDQWNNYGLPSPKEKCFKKPVGFITSSNQTTSAAGLTAIQQSEAIDNFKSGHHKVLVATSVADEGLDIATCNLIIKYNTSGSELTLIQRRGRGRAKGSKSILLALDGAIEKLEFESKLNEKRMHATLNHLYTLPDRAVRDMIAQRTTEIKKQIKEENNRESRKRDLLLEKTWVVTCTKCSERLTTTSFLRSVGKKRIAACDPEIWNKLKIVANTKVEKEGGRQSIEVSRVVCSNGECGNDIASLGTDGNVFMPFLRPSTVALYTEDEFQDPKREGRRAVNRWTDVVGEDFYVSTVSDHDRKEMCIAFEGFDAEKTKNVRRTEDRRLRRRAKAALHDHKERTIVRKIFAKVKEDPNADDDDYGYSTSAKDRITLENDVPLRLAMEAEIDESPDVEPYQDAEFHDSGDEDFEGYEMA